MAKTFDDIKVLLIQARDTEDIERQEQRCFVERCRLRIDQFRPVNVVRDLLDLDLLDGIDAVMIGGAGEYSVTRDYAWTEPLLALIRETADRDLPLFGSCWGHQLIARAFGGEVRFDPEHAEFGSRFVKLTEAGEKDHLLRDFPPCFRANMGHHDRVTRLPENAVELAFNASQRNQAFRIAGKPIYGSQFHSELDAERERERLLRYRANYIEELGSEERFQEILASLVETSEVDHLLHDFLQKFVVAPDGAETT